jgi:hypothetical protein
MRLAQTSSSPQAREQFASLASTWLNLAAELENTLTLLETWEDEGEPQKPPEKGTKKPQLLAGASFPRPR